MESKFDKESVIKNYGDFSNEKVGLKKLARIGQCFSGTKFIVELNKNELVEINDINTKDGEKEYCVSDGCGNISMELAVLIDKEYGYLCGSAYQIRIGGVKGVVMFKPSLSGKCLEVRQSMKKNPSDHLSLEVIRCATFS
jgi:RNA-dependent RNA polymerase